MVTFCLEAFALSLSNAACQLHTLARGHQLVARLTLLVAHALAVVCIELERSSALTFTDTATSIVVEVEVLVGTRMAPFVAFALARIHIELLLVRAGLYGLTLALAGVSVEDFSSTALLHPGTLTFACLIVEPLQFGTLDFVAFLRLAFARLGVEPLVIRALFLDADTATRM